jgi:AAA+ ATPase superfamily predicted ATPase
MLGREPELRVLETKWARACEGRPQLVAVDGRRRVGKTYLVSSFSCTKPAVWYGATHEPPAAELARFARAVRQQLGREVEPILGSSFGSWRSAVRFLGALTTSAPLIVVLDGFDRLLRSNPEASEVVAHFTEDMPPGARLMLVLVGGRLADVLTRAPADVQATVLDLDPLDAASARRFLPRLSPAEFLEAYAACGGYPLHLLQWDQCATTEENLLQLAGTTGGILLDDGEPMLHDGLPDDAVGYFRILAAVGRMQTRYSEIQTAADQRIEHPLDMLSRAGLLRRSVPIGAETSARAAEYEFTDAYLAFWFRVLYASIPEIEAGQGQRVLQRTRPLWERHIERVFQDVARQHARRLAWSGHVPQNLIIGRWWSAGREHALDVLGMQEGSSLLMGRARWSDAPLSGEDLVALHGTLNHVPRPAARPLFALWGRRGVDADVRRAALGFDAAAAVGD